MRFTAEAVHLCFKDLAALVLGFVDLLEFSPVQALGLIYLKFSRLSLKSRSDSKSGCCIDSAYSCVPNNIFGKMWVRLNLLTNTLKKKCADEAGLQRLHLSKEELSPGPGFGDAFDLPEPSSRPYCWFSSLSKYCQINYQGRGQCSTESFLLYNYLEEKDFLNYPKSPKSKHELLKNTQISGKYITFSVLKYWFLSVIFGNGALRAMEVSA